MKRAFHDHLGAAALERGKEEQKRGRHTELALRLRRPWGEWYTAARPFNEAGIPCRVRPIYLPPEDKKKGRGPFLFKKESDPPLFALEVIGGFMPTTMPPVEGLPYHISLDFVREDDARQRWRITQVTRKFMGKEVTPRGHVVGSTYVLNTETCDVGSDPDVQALHQYGDYSHRPLHVSL